MKFQEEHGTCYGQPEFKLLKWKYTESSGKGHCSLDVV